MQDLTATWIAIVVIGSPGIVYLLRNDKKNPWTYAVALFFFAFPIYCGMGQELSQLFVGAAVALVLLLVQFPVVFLHIGRSIANGTGRLARHLWFLLKSR